MVAVIAFPPSSAMFVGLACFAVLGVMFLGDTGIRGRSQLWWSVGALLAAPVVLPVWLAVGIWDRLQGRAGLETLWHRPYRRSALAALVLGAGALVLLVVPVHVRGASARGPGWGGSFSGDCGSTVEIGLGAGAYSSVPPDPSTPAGLRAVQNGVAERCDRVAAQRSTLGGLVLAGAVMVALFGAMDAGRRSGELSTAGHGVS